MQLTLGFLGYSSDKADNSSYHKALKNFQANTQLEPTGKLDKKTQQIIQSESLQRAKVLLISLGYAAELNSDALDEQTKNSLLAFQKRNALKTTGKMDSATLLALTDYLYNGTSATEP